jgi:hypothetical protein
VWSFAGYERLARHPARERVEVLTPAIIVATLAAGYASTLHPSAAALVALRPRREPAANQAWT